MEILTNSMASFREDGNQKLKLPGIACSTEKLLSASILEVICTHENSDIFFGECMMDYFCESCNISTFCFLG